MGKTYYVCCSGCRTEFNESPAKYVAEFEARKAKKSK
jgi:YHS domain-containing protein